MMANIRLTVGDGTTLISQGFIDGQEIKNLLVISPNELPEGTQVGVDQDRELQQTPDGSVEVEFTNPESAQVVIDYLVLIKEELLDHQITKPCPECDDVWTQACEVCNPQANGEG